MHGRKLITSGTVAAIAILAIVAGCKEATTGPSSVKPTDFASSLKLLSGNQQTGAVGAALPEVLSVKVVDAGGQPVAGATVLWQVRAGGGAVNPAASTSSSSGLASVTWTLGTALGANKVVAILQGNYVLDSAVFNATATTGAANVFTVVSGNQQTAAVTTALSQPLVVNVMDQFGHPKSGAKVTWTAGLNSGSIRATVDTTDATGNASATWTLGTFAVTQSATASVTGLSPIGFTAVATPDTSRRMTIVSGGSPAASPVGTSMTSITVKVTDQYGNAIARAPINWRDSTFGGARPTKLIDSTDATGQSSSTWQLGTRPGPQLIRIRETTRNNTVTVSGTATIQFSDVVVGNYHSCAVTTSATVYCWGLNDVGQLAKGTFRNASAPTTAVGTGGDTTETATLIRVRQVTGNRSSICALTVAQDVYCWGHQWGAIESSNTPKAATIKANGGSGGPLSIGFLQVAEDHGCLIQISGVANCTGNNSAGQLGDHQISAPPFTSPSSGTWPFVDSLRTYSNVQLGTTFSCGFHRYRTEAAPDSSQIPLCWGDGASGQRGDSVTTNLAADSASKPKHIKVKGLTAGIAFDSASLAVGDKHACAVAVAPAGVAGQAYCWGLNAHGQLGRVTTGTGNAAMDSTAAPVTAGGVLFYRLFAGKYHTCGLTAAGAAYCWGRNDYGQLGNGTQTGFNTGTATPVAAATGLTFRSLSLGELFTCGITGSPSGAVVGPSPSAGTIYCWGDNSFGQIGNGSASGGNAPVLAATRVLYQP